MTKSSPPSKKNEDEELAEYPTIAERRRAHFLKLQEKNSVRGVERQETVQPKIWSFFINASIKTKIIGLLGTIALGIFINIITIPIQDALLSPRPTQINLIPTAAPIPLSTSAILIPTTVAELNQIETNSQSNVCSTSLVVISIFGFLYLLGEESRKEREHAEWKSFVKAINPLLKKRKIVCEICISAWGSKHNLQERLQKFAQTYPTRVEYRENLENRIKEHILEYHSSSIENNKTPTYIVETPTKSLWRRFISR